MHFQISAHVVHRTPGRLRIKIPAARNQVAFFANLQRQLAGAEGISSVTVNPAAASLVVIHDSGVDPLAVCRGIPYLAFESSVHADVASGRELDLVFLLAKLLPFVFARHPAAQLAEVIAEPVLRAVVGAMTRPQSHRRSTAVREQAEELMRIAA
jgi:Heavy metal associated domain 2